MSYTNTIAIGKLGSSCRKSMLYFHPNVLSYNLAISPSAIRSDFRSSIHLLCEQREREFEDVLEDLKYIAARHRILYEQENSDEVKYDNCIEVTNFDDLIRCASMETPPFIRLAGDITQFSLDPVMELIYNQLQFNTKMPLAPYDTLYQMDLLLSSTAKHSRRACLALDYFSEIVAYMVGEFHGTFNWNCNRQYQIPIEKPCKSEDLYIDIPSLHQLEQGGFSIRPIPCLLPEGGIRTYYNRKSVDIQIVSLADLRYRDFNFPRESLFRGYHADTIIKLSRLIPDKQSFDVAISTGIIPEYLRVDWMWWNDHVISEAYSYEANIHDGCIRRRSETTSNALRHLKRSFDRHTKRSFVREIWDFMKSNRLEFLYSTIMLVFTFMSFLQLLIALGILPLVSPPVVVCLPPS
ncbi:hypothetical protein BJV82DRAFT_636690 [Fennellomyces sp. T-0311]|nr:hypothetical protein BJV82DRAFT_636690 [Fennellomyces sp. T-0311]